ncbi:MAG: hypothetical protein HOQ25_07500 [Mesorhizobium sp.]|nr:hypothetical protein [Mesorhizobium sp.]
MYDDIVPLKLLYKELSISKLARNRFESHNVGRKLGGLHLPIVLDEVDAAQLPKEFRLAGDLELDLRGPPNAILLLFPHERPELVQVVALDADDECGWVHSAKLPRHERAGKRVS